MASIVGSPYTRQLLNLSLARQKRLQRRLPNKTRISIIKLGRSDQSVYVILWIIPEGITGIGLNVSEEMVDKLPVLSEVLVTRGESAIKLSELVEEIVFLGLDFCYLTTAPCSLGVEV